METKNNIDGIFPLTSETENIDPKEDMWTKILVELVGNNNKQVSWLMSNWHKSETIIVNILARCMGCISISSDRKLCEWMLNRGPLTDKLPPYYICPNYKAKN